MSTKRDYLTSPVGEIQFLALNKPVSKTYTKNKNTEAVDENTDALQYGVRLKFDTANKAGKEWYETIKGLNAMIPGRKHINKDTEYTVRAFSSFVPEVVYVDPKTKKLKEGALEELPNFYPTSTGTAQIVVTPFQGQNGYSIKLAGIIIHSLDIGEAPETGREAVMEKIRAALNKTA